MFFLLINKPISFRRIRLLATGLFIITAVVACSQETPATSETSSATNATEKTNPEISTIALEDLKKLAITAFHDQRLYAPATDNALEYYLAIREKSKTPDVLTENALADLMPYTIIAAEQAIANSDFNEAKRLQNLITRVDRNAPALPRLSQAIVAAEKNAQQLLLSSQEKTQETSTDKESVALKINQENTPAAAPNITTKPGITGNIAASAPSPVIEKVQTPVTNMTTSTASVDTSPATTSADKSLSTTPAPIVKRNLVALRTPDPSFPSDALNRGVNGSVEVEFIVQANGEVSEVKVLNSSSRVFDRNVVSTVKRWKFAPLDQPMTVRRSFNFNNPS